MSTGTAIKDNIRETAAKNAATHLIGMLREFIPDGCRREAYDRLASTFYQYHLEITSLAMREEYEAMRKRVIEMTHPIV